MAEGKKPANENEDYSRFRVGAGAKALAEYDEAMRRAQEAENDYLRAKGAKILDDHRK